ncbi:hypothetical protein [Deinococcus navajonensis]|uniref:Replication protein n=1 Tax=Deinococcus navajonensis TaxID=309884 RepID=A0ABV8XR80_9DEIO
MMCRDDFRDAPVVVRLIQTGEQVVRTLTACLDEAPCRESARVIFRTLYTIALEVARMQGHAASVTRAVFHLPAELVMVHVGLRKSAFYDNLRHLQAWGLVASKAHMGDLRGKSAATGTLWVVALQPERVLSGHAPGMRLRHEDWTARKWRDLNADVKIKRTVYALVGGRKPAAGQSRNLPHEEDGLKDSQKNTRPVVDLADLVVWAKTPLFPHSQTDTLTVRPAPTQGLEVVWALADASQVKRHERAAIVNRQAQALAAAFGDGPAGLGFWRKLIWNITRGLDAGESLADDVGVVLARVLADVRHDLSNGTTPPRKPAAVVNAALTRAGLLDRLRSWEWRVVGSRPAA